MIELRTESSIDFQRDRLVLVNAGIIDGVPNVVVYANIGHSVCLALRIAKAARRQFKGAAV